MGSRRISQEEKKKIQELRGTGHSLSEIADVLGHGKSTIAIYARNVPVLPEFRELYNSKRGGSHEIAAKKWTGARTQASEKVPNISEKERLIILSCLYWGEGNKKDFCLTNTNPDLIITFINCLYGLGVKKEMLLIGLRLYEDINREEAIKYWADLLKVPTSQIRGIYVIKGKKIGKLRYGMCRIRVKKPAEYFKLIKSIIELIALKTAE